MYIDDGKISSVIRSLTDEHLELEILSPSSTTAKIKPEKGLNFPDSNLNLPALTSNDIGNLGLCTILMISGSYKGHYLTLQNQILELLQK